MRAKDLGLLIVDEEQRFGVKQKELLRQLRLRVDVIAMSATPIPRTLQMSLAGLRDISVIETPPEGRRPVKTYVGEYDEELVRQALEREHARGGQAFFLHNRVETIDETAERLRGLCPGMRFEVAPRPDGRDASSRQVMLGFLRGEADVLVCTTIIESGIDIPQANTLIVERADTFGLSQLYQIRGRVGRSRERAYAYLLFDSAAAAHPGGGAAPGGAVRLHRARRRLPDRDARPRAARRGEPARRRAVRPRRGARLRALHADARRGGPRGRAAATRPSPSGSRCAWTSTSTPTCRPTTSPTSRRRSTCTGASPARSRSPTLETLREELEDRFGAGAGAAGEPARAPARADQARRRPGRERSPSAGAGWRSSPIELDSAAARGPARAIPGRLYESGRSQVSLRVPDDPAGRFPAVLAAADAVLAAARAARRLTPLPCAPRGPLDPEVMFLRARAPWLLCGGATPHRLRRRRRPATAIATVGDASRSRKAAFDHWLTVAKKSGFRRPGRAAPPLDPPNFTACVAYHQRTDPKPAKGQPNPTRRQLKTECQRPSTRRATRSCPS